MLISVSKTKTYIPEWNDNQQLPVDQQIVATYKNPDNAMRRRLAPRANVKFDYDAQGNPTGGSGEIVMDDESVVRGMLISLTNLECDINGKITRISDAESLLSAPIETAGLIKELAKEFGKELKKEAPEKN